MLTYEMTHNKYTMNGIPGGYIQSNDGARHSFEEREWKSFRIGSGKGSKANQKDIEAFLKFVMDQGFMQYRETFRYVTSWRNMILRTYY